MDDQELARYGCLPQHEISLDVVYSHLSYIVQTTVVSQCADDIVSWAEAEGYETPRVGLVNMASLFASSIAKDGIQKGMLEQVAKRMGLGNDASMANLEKQAKDNVLILIIDEVDMLLKRQDSDGERFFRDLIRIANEEHLGLRLIGISNSVNDDSYTRIREIGAVSGTVIFVHFVCKCMLSNLFISLLSRKRLFFLHMTRVNCLRLSPSVLEIALWIRKRSSWCQERLLPQVEMRAR